MLRNPKYTGYQVIGRRRHGSPSPLDQWHWSPAPSHPAIVDRATWDAAQAVGAEHATSWDGTNPHPSARRAYALRSRIRCKICQRRMCGITKPTRTGPGSDNSYYVCQHDPANPRHVAAAPDHPRTVAAREDLLLAVLRDTLTAYTLAPGRKERLAELLPAGAAAQKAQTDTQAAALDKRLKQIDTAQDSLIHDLHILPTDPADTAAHAMRARIHAHFTDLHHQRETIEAELAGPGQRPRARQRRRPAGRTARTGRAPGRAARAPPGRPVRRVRHPGRVEPADEPGHLLRRHHRHHPRHRHRPAHPRRRRPRQRRDRPRPHPDPRHQQQRRVRIHASPYLRETCADHGRTAVSGREGAQGRGGGGRVRDRRGRGRRGAVAAGAGCGAVAAGAGARGRGGGGRVRGRGGLAADAAGRDGDPESADGPDAAGTGTDRRDRWEPTRPPGQETP